MGEINCLSFRRSGESLVEKQLNGYKISRYLRLLEMTPFAVFKTKSACPAYFWQDSKDWGDIKYIGTLRPCSYLYLLYYYR